MIGPGTLIKSWMLAVVFAGVGLCQRAIAIAEPIDLSKAGQMLGKFVLRRRGLPRVDAAANAVWYIDTLGRVSFFRDPPAISLEAAITLAETRGMLQLNRTGPWAGTKQVQRHPGGTPTASARTACTSPCSPHLPRHTRSTV